VRGRERKQTVRKKEKDQISDSVSRGRKKRSEEERGPMEEGEIKKRGKIGEKKKKKKKKKKKPPLRWGRMEKGNLMKGKGKKMETKGRERGRTSHTLYSRGKGKGERGNDHFPPHFMGKKYKKKEEERGRMFYLRPSIRRGLKIEKGKEGQGRLFSTSGHPFVGGKHKKTRKRKVTNVLLIFPDDQDEGRGEISLLEEIRERGKRGWFPGGEGTISYFGPRKEEEGEQ